MGRRTGFAARIVVMVCLGVGTGVAGSPSIFARQEPPGQVFRGGTTLVYVDVYPRQDERFVEGLRPEDFQVTEDGKPQSVQSFEIIRFEPSPIDADRRDPTSMADSERQAADPRNRLFVVYLDMYHSTRNGSRDVRQPVLDFLNRTIGATDLFAVMTPETPVSSLTFGRRTDTVEAELTRFWNWGQADRTLGGTTIPRSRAEERIVRCAFAEFAAQSDGDARVEAVVQRYRDDLTYNSLEGLVFRLRDLRDERKNVLLLSGGLMMRRPQPRLAEFQARPQLPKVGVTPGGRIVMGDPQSLNPDQSACRGDIARLASMDFATRFSDLITAATRANVSFYPVDVEGLTVAGGAGSETLRTLANATDGYAAVNSNDLSIGFRRIADRLSAYYLLGYYSNNSVNDGKFRKIDVKVSRPGVSVAARRGYMALPPDAVVAKARAEAVARAGPALTPAFATEIEKLGRLSAGLEVFAVGIVRPRAIDVVVELGTRERERGRWAKGADVEVRATDPAGASATATGRIDAGGRAISVSIPVEGARGPWQVRARATGDQGPADDRIELAAPTGPLLGSARAYRGAPSLRSPLQPVAEFQFRRNERLHVEWPVVKAAGLPTARVLDRRGQPIGSALPLTEREVEDGRVIMLDLPLSGLAEGDYAVEVTIREGSVAEVALVAFRVGR